MTNRNKASSGSKRTEELRQQIREFYQNHGFIDWAKLKISGYMRMYHKLQEYSESLVDSSFVDHSVENKIEDKDIEILNYSSHPDPASISAETYVVVSVDVSSESLNDEFIETLKRYADFKNAKLLVVPQAQKKAHLDEQVSLYSSFCEDPYITIINEYGLPELRSKPVPLFRCLEDRGFTVVLSKMDLHRHLALYPLFVNPKVQNPISGLRAVIPSMKNAIIASSKQRLEHFPSPKNHLPYIVWTTGTISNPAYKSGSLLTKQELIADLDHQFGAVVVEIDGDRFHARHLLSRDGGTSIIDFDGTAKKYTAEAVSPAKIMGIVPGDWHSGYTDVGVATVLFDVAKNNDIPEVLLHDTCDGHSENPHEKHQNLTLMKKASEGMLDVEREIVGVAHDILEWEKVVDRVNIVRSNHDEFIDREIEGGKYTKHPYSAGPLTIVAGEIIKSIYKTGHQPYALPVAIQCLAQDIRGVPKFRNTHFLERDVLYTIEDVDVSHHGDKLINGRPTNLTNIASAMSQSVTGHNHAPGLFRGAYRVGTSSVLDLNYNKGLSSWLHTFALIFEGGTVQLINIIDGVPYRGYKMPTEQAQIATNKAHLKYFK